jgi:hypothetical protein
MPIQEFQEALALRIECINEISREGGVDMQGMFDAIEELHEKEV